MRNLFFRKYWTNTLDRDFERMKILRRDPGRILERCDLGLLDLCDRTTSEMRGLSPKIISGDSR
jgi:hypothetical protein